MSSTYFWSEQEFITGDNIELLGNYIFDIENLLFGFHGRQQTNKTEQQLIDDQIQYINTHTPEIIFCYGHDTSRLLTNIDKINYNFKLLTHNSDIGILPEYNHYVNSNKIIKWFGQNNFLSNSKIVSIPIGIARQKYPHGDIKLLSSISQQNFKKCNNVYKNFSAETNFNERIFIDTITTSNGIPMAAKCSQYEYLKAIAESNFVISPPGNGIDCHRIWECLYLGAIPVVKYHTVLEQFKHLPILFIDSWDEVTPDFLSSKLYMREAFNIKLETLSFNYWRDLILQ